MGGRGMYSATGGFTRREYETVGMLEDLKVIEPIDKSKKKANLPLYSGTPGTSYIKLDDEGHFRQLRVYGEDRLPVLDIDYGRHKPLTGDEKGYHAHDWQNGKRQPGRFMTDKELQRYQKYFV
jgi:hypothetical protein